MNMAFLANGDQLKKPTELIQHLRAQFRLDWHGIHGASHWARVKHHGL